MNSDFKDPINIGSDEMVTINQLAEMVISISNKDISIHNIDGDEFFNKYGYHCPIGVNGRNSDNMLYYQKIGWKVSEPLLNGIKKTYEWIKKQVHKSVVN